MIFVEIQQYTLIKIPIKEIISAEYDVCISREKEIKNEYIITQGDSPLFDYIETLRGFHSSHIFEIILVVAKKNPKQEEHLRHILEHGFTYNGLHFLRFGKSASQGKDGITAFVYEAMYANLYKMTQMDVEITECVISKYEAYRCLSFSTCTLVRDYIPNIVIVDEYKTKIKDQLIKYVVEKRRTFVDKSTGETKEYNAREIEESPRDIKLSPFDGCGCHEHEFMEHVSAQLGLDYNAIGVQVRMPFIKGYSVYVPFREIYKEWGVTHITDVYGVEHDIDTIDCIWNTSMFKGADLFSKKYGNDAWNSYIATFIKYKCKLGISKYSHHIKNLNRMTRMNFQYLQCLDLWNQKYIDYYESGDVGSYDVLDPGNDGKIISLAKYTTKLFERIIMGDKFFTYKFMGINNTDTYEPESKYLEAVLVNDVMLRDPTIKQFIYRKLKRFIDEAKVGKIYCNGLYHTGVGDMIGYLQYAAGLEITGCLNAGELYCPNFPSGEVVSFRSPLVDPSEVNRIRIVRNELADKWFGYFKDQDVVMFNMRDISGPQQGGANHNWLPAQQCAASAFV